MSYTNHTTNYNLPQYIGTDKPTYLGDFNTAMGAIDTQMKANADAASTAGTTATAASNAIGALANLTTTDKTSVVNAINEVDTNADTAQQTASTAATNASAALSAVSKFDFTTFSSTTVTATNGTMVSGNNTLSYATNADGSLGKLYGRCIVDSTTTSAVTLKCDTGFRPTESINVDGILFITNQGSDKAMYQRIVPMTIGTDGKVTISISNSAANTRYYVFSFACVIFLKNFGD